MQNSEKTHNFSGQETENIQNPGEQIIVTTEIKSLNFKNLIVCANYENINHVYVNHLIWIRSSEKDCILIHIH